MNSYQNVSEARDAVFQAFQNLTSVGIIVKGFVCPGNHYVDDYRSMLADYHRYVFGTSSMVLNTQEDDVLKLKRYCIETIKHTEQEVKSAIDAACAEGKLLIFYGHARNIHRDGYHNLDFYDMILQYINKKVKDGVCFFSSPDKCVEYYFRTTSV